MRRAAYSLLLIACVSGCAPTIPKAALRLPQSTLEVRAIQTRTLEASSEIAILTATIAVLQDMEFNIDRIEKPLGVITASKLSDADRKGEKAGLFFLDMLCVISNGVSCEASSTARDDQHITMTIVVLPSLALKGAYLVRITIQRVIHDKVERIKVLERIDDAETYQDIFDNLRKSLFIQEGDK
jgi:hypothetical protein